MKPVAERCSIVMSGAWNQAIFMPKWVEGLTGSSPEPSLDLLFGPGGLAYRLALKGKRLWLEVLPHQLLIAPEVFGDRTLTEMDDVAVSILTRLKETPVRAVGINFGFDVSEESSTFSDLFRPSDTQSLASVDATVESTTVTRKIMIDKLTLNLSARRDGGAPRLDFNYHHVVTSADEARTAIHQRVVDLKERALLFAKSVYGLTLERT